MSRVATRGNAITMTPPWMGRSGIHFTRERIRSKKALRSSDLVRAGYPDPPVPCDRRAPSPRLSARHLETFCRPRGVVWKQSPNKGLPGLGAKRWVLPPHGRSAASGEKKFDLSETVARFGDILNKVRPIIEIGPRSVFGNRDAARSAAAARPGTTRKFGVRDD